MTKICFLLIALLSITLSSCVTQGNQRATDPAKLAHFKKGVTTKADVYASLGQPHDVRQSSPGSRWSYYQTKSTINPSGFIPVVGLVLPSSNVTANISHLYFDKRERFSRKTTKSFSDQQNSFASVARGIKSFSQDTQHKRVKAEMERLGFKYDKREALKAKDMGTILGANPEL